VNSRKTSNKLSRRRPATHPGKIVVISSPSGGGKTTICRKLRERNPAWRFSVSFTTRDRRPGERNGREYTFVDRKEFAILKRNGFFAESARVHLHWYGTPRASLDAALSGGRVILLDVDVQGALSIRRRYPEALLIFIFPPTGRELQLRLARMAVEKRLRRRGTESTAELAVRLQNAMAEMKKFHLFDYIIINDDLNKAVNAADHMIKSWTVGVTFFGRNKSPRQSVT
jgi:guanylate kinase